MIVEHLEEIPLARMSLSLEVPEEIAARLCVISIELYFNVTTYVVLPFL